MLSFSGWRSDQPATLSVVEAAQHVERCLARWSVIPREWPDDLSCEIDGQRLDVYTARPHSASEQAGTLLAGWTEWPDLHDGQIVDRVAARA